MKNKLLSFNVCHVSWLFILLIDFLNLLICSRIILFHILESIVFSESYHLFQNYILSLNKIKNNNFDATTLQIIFDRGRFRIFYNYLFFLWYYVIILLESRKKLVNNVWHICTRILQLNLITFLNPTLCCVHLLCLISATNEIPSINGC